MDQENMSVTAPALVVVGYSRPRALQRILDSLARQDIPSGCVVPLIISIDGNNSEVLAVARSFEWGYGKKRVVVREPRLGLRNHILACGDLAHDYGAVVILEDDLYASPDLVRFAIKARDGYAEDPRIAGVAMYALRVNELSGLPFYPCDDGHDVFFAQFPCSWGQMWTSDQWAAFRTWYNTAASNGVRVSDGVPQTVANWPESSWKKYFCRYLVEKDRWFVFPRQGLTTNCGDPGTHVVKREWRIISHITKGRHAWSFPSLSNDSIRYDAWLEPHPHMLGALWPGIDWSDVTIDLYGQKDLSHVRTKRLLSLRSCRRADATFPLVVLPVECNLDLPNLGRFFALGPTEAFDADDQFRFIQLIELLGAHVSSYHAALMICLRVVARCGRVWERVKENLARRRTTSDR